MKHEPESRPWIRQVPTPPGRSLHVPLMIFVYVLSGPLPQGACVIGGGVSTVLYAEDLGSTYSYSPNREAGSRYGAEQEFFWARRYRQDLFWRDIWQRWNG